MHRTTEGDARDAFRARFGEEPSILARAPGRVELLGNHTDYNGGLVLAAAIDRSTWVAIREVPDFYRPCRVFAAHFDRTARLGPHLSPPVVDGVPLPDLSQGEWTRYVAAVAAVGWGRVRPGGGSPEIRYDSFDAAIVGDVPLGAGLSSSASLEAALALAILAIERPAVPTIDPDDPTRLEIARRLRRIEHEAVDVPCGLLDQFAAMMGRAGHALLLDCRSEAFERLPLGDPPPAIVVCDGKTSRRLADGMYARRLAECEAVVGQFRALRGEAVAQLRDLSADDLAEVWDRIDPVGRRRARHVVTENDRVRRGAEALKAGDTSALGRLMTESHRSSRDDFANSSDSLDALIEAAEAAPGYLGGKLSGAGWAGCTANLVEPGKAEDFAEAVRSAHARRTGTTPEVHICRAADGAGARRLGR